MELKGIRLDKGNFAGIAANLPARARLALAAAMALPRGLLDVRIPDGRRLIVGDNAPGPRAKLVLNNWRLPARAFAGGSIGVAESYVDGDWESPDVTTFLELFVANREDTEHMGGRPNWLFGALQRLRHWLNENTPRGSRRNIAAHYDLGNEFYGAWLDPGMTYSAALFSSGANDLESAQAAKYRALARDAEIGPDDHVLEIGCGWGGFAEFAAREIGCRVTGITISKEQHVFAAARIARAGLSDKVAIRLQDYRDAQGCYDHIASIEMLEAVGEKYWPHFFRKIKESLKPGGSAALQIITINGRAFPAYRRRPDFIQRHIFPGGMLPSPAILKSLGAENGLAFTRERIFPEDYARTLALWRQRFLASWGQLVSLGFDERFRRLWEFYLHYCEAGFRTEYIDVRQMIYRA
jgi:cyclopropane-fatty-acyl-phospholipid synthase